MAQSRPASWLARRPLPYVFAFPHGNARADYALFQLTIESGAGYEKAFFLQQHLRWFFAASAIAQTSTPQSDQIIPPRDPPLGKADMGPDTPYESNSAAGYEPNSATGTEGLSRGTEGLSRGATEPREEFRPRREEKEER